MAVAAKQKPKQTSHHKRRHGMHQKRSHQFSKTYWPYLPMLLIVVTGMLINTYLIRPNVLGYATNMTAYGLLEYTNESRETNGAKDLTLNATLAKAAQAKAEDMAARNYWSHKTPDHKEPWTFIDNTGYAYVAAAENLAYGFETSDQAVKGWMNSPEHKSNLVNNEYTEVGFGIANSPNFQSHGEETIVVALYAKPAVASATPSSEMQVSAVVPQTSKNIARVQLATSGSAPWSALVLLTLTLLLVMFIIAKHSRVWRKRLVHGEQFILKHKVLDVVIVGVIMLGFVLTRTAGIIH